MTETTETGFILSFDTPLVSYTVTPLPQFTGRLRVSVRATLEREGGSKKFRDRLDLTSARARAETVKVMCRALDFETEVAEAHLSESLEVTDAWVESQSSTGPADGETEVQA